MKNIIETKKLCKTFSNGGIQQHVLKNIDLEIYEGDFTIIMGASGAGKSTLLYSLSGMRCRLRKASRRQDLPCPRDVFRSIGLSACRIKGQTDGHST